MNHAVTRSTFVTASLLVSAVYSNAARAQSGYPSFDPAAAVYAKHQQVKASVNHFRPSNTPTNKRSKTGMNITLTTGGKLIVDAVTQGLPAHLAGVELGDQVMKVNGRRVLNYRDLVKALTASTTRVQLTVMKRDHRIRTIMVNTSRPPLAAANPAMRPSGSVELARMVDRWHRLNQTLTARGLAGISFEQYAAQVHTPDVPAPVALPTNAVFTPLTPVSGSAGNLPSAGLTSPTPVTTHSL